MSAGEEMGLIIRVAPGFQFAPHVAGAMAIILTAHPRDALPAATLAVYNDMLKEYDAELLKWAAVECVAQIKWIPKLHEIKQVILHIQSLIEHEDEYHRKQFVGRAVIDGRAELAEFKRRCSAGTWAYIGAERAKKLTGQLIDLPGERHEKIERIGKALHKWREAQARGLINAEYCREYIEHLESRLEEADRGPRP